MVVKTILFLLSKLEGSPLLKKTLGQIIFRLFQPPSPFFRPLLVVASVVAVLASILVKFRDELAPMLGLSLSPTILLTIQMFGSVSAAIAWVSALTLDEEGVATLNRYLGKNE